jgi:uncharacterized membrane protein YdbT with pleckstrin-like domain
LKLNLGEYFYPTPGSAQEEEIVIFARRHWVSYLGQIALSIILILLPIILWLVLELMHAHIYQGNLQNAIVIVGSVYYLVAITFTFATWISYYYDIYIVTRDTIVDITQVGFFGRKVSQLSLLRVQDVTSNIKGILPTLFAYGDVLVETAGERSETFLLESVANPQEFSAKILELHNQLIEKEGRHHEMLEAEGVLAVPASSESKESEPKIPQQEQSQKEIEKSAKRGSTDSGEGEISKDDLNKGGEVKF